MGVPRRMRDLVSLYYVLLGCAMTTFYFLIVNTSWSSIVTTFEHDNVSSRNYEYMEMCKEWKLALDNQKSAISVKSRQEQLPTMEFDVVEDNDMELSSHFHCDNSYKDRIVTQRGQYYVFYNFVQAEKEFGCTESITLSAPGDFRFLDNIIPLVDRWRGPISVALYAPGYDFYTTLKSIAYLRNCESPSIRQLVSFHVVFDQDHTPKLKPNGTNLLDAYKDEFNCSIQPPWLTVDDKELYKTKLGLLYPINLARNVAKLASKTYFVFPSDIELYPTRHFISLFLKFVGKNMDLFKADQKNVFVLPIFEILANQTVPENKNRLLQMLKEKTAIIFHQMVCTVCHRVIDSEKWVRTEETEGLDVFSVGKRIGRYMVWEPFFVCTQNEPLWDERMTWEGQNNKMIQAYTLCLMDYNFHVLDNAFLIHKPGVKKKKVQMEKFKQVVRQSTKLIRKIAVELQEIYGYSTSCTTIYKTVTKNPLKKPQNESAKTNAKNPAARNNSKN